MEPTDQGTVDEQERISGVALVVVDTQNRRDFSASEEPQCIGIADHSIDCFGNADAWTRADTARGQVARGGAIEPHGAAVVTWDGHIRLELAVRTSGQLS